MKVFVVEYDNGDEYEYKEIETIGVFGNLKQATDFITSCGFIQEEDFFIRQHDYVPGKSSEHQDYAYIHQFELNKPK